MLEGLINSFRVNDEDEEDYLPRRRRNEEDEDDYDYEERKQENRKVIPLRKIEEKESNIVIMRPKDIIDAKSIIDQLMDGNSVMIDLGKTDEAEKQRVMDMISGYCYAFHCNIERVNSTTFVVSHAEIQFD